MRTQTVVVIDVASDRLPQLPGGAEFINVNQLRFQAAEPALDHNIVCPTRFTVHALADMQSFQKLFILVACKLASLIRVEN